MQTIDLRVIGDIAAKAEKQLAEIANQYTRGLITCQEYHAKSIDILEQTGKKFCAVLIQPF